ncbi:MAG: radical SAM protein [Deltaproteobacteria bacterium]|nr:radical SAM protein [Deltaproteobacteria bacterium]MBN2844973.1 radical SAM protein [Deltaproteobacteria bacterium]
MKIVLVAPPYPLEEIPSPPLGICYAAAACEAAGAEVVILDYIVRKYTPEKLMTELDALKPDAIGTSSVTMNFTAAADIMRTAKNFNPSIITMMGGPHVSFDVESTLTTYPEIDLIVIGEGEETLKELVPSIRDRSLWKEIKGIAFHEKGEIVFTEPRELIQDLDTLPIPARHLLPMSRYLALGFPVSVITSRGCPNRCIFCQGRRMVGYKVRHRTPELVVDEIEDILSYGWTRINIADDIFTANKKRVLEFCNEIKKRNISFTWSAFARVNTVNREILQAMKEVGCDSVSFGIESGNPEMLKRIKKGITLDQARKATKYCKDAGMIAHASFMVGLPGESRETMNDSRDFAEELDILYGYHFLAPFPGTTVRERIEDYDLEILTNDWNLYDANSPIVRTSQLAPEDMENFVSDVTVMYQDEWRKTEKKYHEGTCSPEDHIKIEGFYRTEIIFRLLSQDLIETIITPEDEEDPAGKLCDKLSEIMADIGCNGLVKRTIMSLLDAKYIKSKISDGTISWYWTHNNRLDELPVSHP